MLTLILSGLSLYIALALLSFLWYGVVTTTVVIIKQHLFLVNTTSVVSAFFTKKGWRSFDIL